MYFLVTEFFLLDIRTLALCTLSFLVEDHEQDLLKVDKFLLQYCVQCIYGAADSKGKSHNGWLMEELLALLSRLARNDSNKRLILRTGKTDDTCKIVVLENLLNSLIILFMSRYLSVRYV